MDKPGGSMSVESVRQARLLIVEDERHTARFLEFVLRKEGYQVVLAANGEQALATLDSIKPDAILLDLVLPGISGLDVIRSVRSDLNYRELVVVVLTARSFEDTPEEIIQAGADSHCAKSTAPSTLVKKLRDFGVPPRLSCDPGSVRECRQPVV
jgi:DNA-binding response OmpR family regulator